jgi:hypothetical protein
LTLDFIPGLISRSRVKIGVRDSPTTTKLIGTITFLAKSSTVGQDIFNAVRDSLNKKLWKVATPTSESNTQEKTASFTPTTAGIGGIIRKVDSKAKKTDEMLQQAFTDLDTLLIKAREMV